MGDWEWLKPLGMSNWELTVRAGRCGPVVSKHERVEEEEITERIGDCEFG